MAEAMDKADESALVKSLFTSTFNKLGGEEAPLSQVVDTVHYNLHIEALRRGQISAVNEASIEANGRDQDAIDSGREI
jgi:hypothetical protein